MANGIDKLERLFSKKKAAAAAAATHDHSPAARPSSLAYASATAPSRFTLRKPSFVPSSSSSNSSSTSSASFSAASFYSTQSAASSAAATAASQQDVHFPQPSFIRPRASRMIPRDDSGLSPSVSLSSSYTSSSCLRPATAGRSQSVPQPPALPLRAPSWRGVAPAAGAHGCTTAYRDESPCGTNTAAAAAAAAATTPAPAMPQARSMSLVNTPRSRPLPLAHSSAHSVDHPPLRRSSSLLQRRDVFVAPLERLHAYQLPPPPQQQQEQQQRQQQQQQQQQVTRTSIAITLSSGEVSPTTILQPTPVVASACLSSASSSASSSTSLAHDDSAAAGAPPALAIHSDDLPLHDLRDLHDLPDLQAIANLHTLKDLKDLNQPLLFSEQPREPATSQRPETAPEAPTKAEVEETVVKSPASTAAPTTVQTPPRRRSSVLAPIVLPQTGSASPPPTSSARRRSRIIHRRPMSLRYQRHLPAQPPTPSSPSSVLMEPNLGDFLTLSDDDIAEAVSAGGGQQPPSHAKVAPAPSEASVSPPVSPTAATRRRALTAGAPAHPPPSFHPPPPVSMLSWLPGMPLLPTPSPSPSAHAHAHTPSPSLSLLFSANGHPRTPAGESRMAAAFEIARIASQHGFDLAYVATIWPRNMACVQASATTPTPAVSRANSLHSRANTQTPRAHHISHVSQASQTSFVSTASTASTTASALSSHPKLEAQFLAAYGLATVRAAPYSPSAPTHARILNADRWVEIREPDEKPDEFAYGYGCAFYRGHAAVVPTAYLSPSQQRCAQRRPSTDDCDADTEQDAGSSGTAGAQTARRINRRAAPSSLTVHNGSSSGSSYSQACSNNRGIVFVAYRSKDVGDERRAQDDLDGLYRDVEALVDKILDVHMQQQRQAQLGMRRVSGGVDPAPTGSCNDVQASA